MSRMYAKMAAGTRNTRKNGFQNASKLRVTHTPARIVNITIGRVRIQVL
jgi:hypothetical protein